MEGTLFLEAFVDLGGDVFQLADLSFHVADKGLTLFIADTFFHSICY